MSDYKKTAFVIAHHHQEGHLTKNLFDHVRYIHRFAEKIIFVSTKLNKNSIQKLKPYANVIVRKNEGYDFYSYKVGLNAISNILDVEHLIFFNSSFLTTDPSKLYKKYLSSITDDGFYGISSCSAPRYHIQSYFFSFFGKQIIQSKAFDEWWEKIELTNDREAVIQKYEVGMTQWFLAQHFNIRPLYVPNTFEKLLILYRYLRLLRLDHLNLFFSLKNIPHYLSRMKPLLLANNFGCNPTHFLFDRIYKVFSIIKIEFLIKNPKNQNLDNFLKYLIQQKSNKISGIKFLIQRNTNTRDKKLSRH